MSTDAADVAALLPADMRVGEIEVVDIEVGEDWDFRLEEIVEVTLTLAEPTGDTWSVDDINHLESRIRRGLVRAGEERFIGISLRSARSADEMEPEEDEEPDDGFSMPMPMPRRSR